MKRNTRQITLYTSRGALIAALYVVLTMVATMVGLSSGVIQFRISEALCILPIFFPEAVPGLFIGCLISNLMVPGVAIWDVIFGSLATLLGALGAYYLRRRLTKKTIWIATIPTILANMIIIPPVLILAYGVTDAYFFLVGTIALGEIVCAGIGGTVLYNLLKAAKIKKIFNNMK